MPDAATRSVIVPVHGRAALTRGCLELLLRNCGSETEVLVVDDASPDGTAAMLADFRPRVRVIRRERAGGFGVACNDGAAAAAADLLVFLNNDTLPGAGWLDRICGYAADHPGAGAVGCKLVWPDGTVQHAGVVFDRSGHARHLYEGFPSDHPAVCRSRRLQAVTGAALLVRREAFEQAGGFDTAFLNGWEDVDLCLRLGGLGWEVHMCAEAELVHLESATRGRTVDSDLPNWKLHMERWAGRVESDHLRAYEEDGLLRVRYTDSGPAVEVSPLLDPRAADARDPLLGELLAERSRRGLDLLRENVRLKTRRGPAAMDGSVPDQSVRAAADARDAGVSSIELSVVVPVGDHGVMDTHLAALAAQTLAGRCRYEVLLGGPEPHLESTLAAIPDSAARPAELSLAPSDPAGGRAAAINRAIERTRGRLVVMLVDDFIAPPEFLESHLAAHHDDPRRHVAVLGPAVFPGRLRDTPFRRWLEDSGELFGISFTSGERPPGWFWYCANTSLKREFLVEGPLFDERLPFEAWDDAELALRLRDRGMEVRYEPRAVVVHEHPLTLEERSRTMFMGGRSAAIHDRIYPPPHRFATRTDASTPLLALSLSARLAGARHRLFARERDQAERYRAMLRRSFLEGYRAEAWSHAGKAVPDRRNDLLASH